MLQVKRGDDFLLKGELFQYDACDVLPISADGAFVSLVLCYA